MTGDQFGDEVIKSVKSTGWGLANENETKLVAAGIWRVLEPKFERMIDALASVQAEISVDGRKQQIETAKKSFAAMLNEIS